MHAIDYFVFFLLVATSYSSIHSRAHGPLCCEVIQVYVCACIKKSITPLSLIIQSISYNHHTNNHSLLDLHEPLC